MSLKKIKVLHIIKTLDLGGAETNLLNLLQASDPEKVDSVVAYSDGGELEAVFKEQNIQLYKYAETNHKVKSMASLAIIARLYRYIKKNNIDIIHSHNLSAHIWGAAAAKLAGIKILEHVHDFRYVESEDFARRRGVNNQYSYIRYLKNVSDRIIVLTEQNEQLISDQGINIPENVRIIRNGIKFDDQQTLNEDQQAKLLAEMDIPASADIIFTPIRMAAEKNADLIIRVAKEVISNNPSAVFLMVGNGPLHEELRAEVKALGLTDNIKLPGFYQNVIELLSISDIFLLPSFLELHSIAILEAMSQRVPVVVSENTGSNSAFIVHKENGYLLDPFSDEGWADALSTLLNDAEHRKTVAINGYDTCKELFNINDTARRMTDVYFEMVTKS